ncbi:RNA polymerase sigma factor [Streptomyces sp. NPDC054855]
MNEPSQGNSGPSGRAPAAQAPSHDLAPATRTRVNDEFSTFYRATLRPLVQFLINQGAPVHLAADIAQETLSKAYSRWTEVDHPRGWVHKVASRALIRHMSRTVEDPTGDVPEASPLVPHPDALSEWESKHSILRILQNLPPRQRQVLAWTFSGYTPTEIAAEIDLTPAAVRSNLKKARRTALQQIEQHGEHR